MSEEDDGNEPKRRGEELMKKLLPGPDTKITSVTIGIGRRCPHCGQLPEDFRDSFERLVQLEYIVPEKSKHLSTGPEGVFEYVPTKDCMSPKGRYPAVIVPHWLVGKVVLIKEKTERDGDATDDPKGRCATEREAEQDERRGDKGVPEEAAGGRQERRGG